jgi:ATP/ADP translocase
LIEKDLTAYLSSYAVWTGIISTFCVLFGINNIQRKLGMTVSLVLMPVIIGVAVVVLRLNPIISVAFWIMVCAKAINYALGQPSLKQAYIPTSKDSKYKAQSWIEAFGGRSSKSIGSGINAFGKMPIYFMLSSAISLGIVAMWVFVAIFIAKTYNKAIKENKIVC